MSTDWREKYLALADQLDADQAAHAAAERELTRLVTRVCVACSGLDPALDPPLEGLRRAARSGRIDDLLARSDAFADAIVRAGEDRVRPGVLQRLCEHGGVKGRDADELLALWGKVSADPAAASGGVLDRLSALLGPLVAAAPAPETAGGRSRPGLLGRLIGHEAARPSANHQLLEVLDAVAWPDDLSAQVDAYRAALGPDAGADAWVDVVKEVGELTTRALRQAQQSAQSAGAFLEQLNDRLVELDRHMLEDVERRDASRQSGRDLGRRMHSEVGSLTDSVRQVDNLNDLQTQVIASLDRIRAHVDRHLDEESERLASAEAEASRLRKHLQRLERDSFDLRDQVAQTYRQAMRDPLTGLANRRAYEEKVDHEYARWKRFGDPLALLVLDVDDFKQINDRFGHSAGDKALVMIARVLDARPRQTDFIARYGGEEFVVLFTGAHRDDALRVADAMRLGVANSGLHASGEPLQITVSGGLAMFASGDDPAAVFERADAALYRAKHEGKNRIVLAEDASKRKPRGERGQM